MVEGTCPGLTLPQGTPRADPCNNVGFDTYLLLLPSGAGGHADDLDRLRADAALHRLICLPSSKAGAKAMVHSREIYRSPNGDRWLLVREPDTGRVFVRHEPNAASGGRPDEDEVGAFLSRDPHTPERQALLRLIGTLAEDR